MRLTGGSGLIVVVVVIVVIVVLIFALAFVPRDSLHYRYIGETSA